MNYFHSKTSERGKCERTLVKMFKFASKCLLKVVYNGKQGYSNKMAIVK
jgi:hypothetical protein